MKDLNGAFPETPEYVRSAIHLGLTRARRREKRKRRLFALASVAAVLAVMLGALSLAASGRRFSGGLPHSTNPGPLAHGQVTAVPTPTAAPTAMPTPMTTAVRTPTVVNTRQPTPMPSVIVTAISTARTSEKTALSTAVPFPTPMPASDGPAKAAVSEAALVSAAPEDAERMVYSTKGGKYYHSRWNCSGMLGASLRPVSEAEALGQIACPICVATEPTVWTTRAGTYYHDSAYCSGMRYSVSMTESKAVAAGRKLCPVCQANRARELPAELYSTDRGMYYHTDPTCSGMLGAVSRTEEEVKKLGQKACPICIGG